MINLLLAIQIHVSKIHSPVRSNPRVPVHTETLFFDTTPPKPVRRKNRKERRAERKK